MFHSIFLLAIFIHKRNCNYDVTSFEGCSKQLNRERINDYPNSISQMLLCMLTIFRMREMALISNYMCEKKKKKKILTIILHMQSSLRLKSQGYVKLDFLFCILKLRPQYNTKRYTKLFFLQFYSSYILHTSMHTSSLLLLLLAVCIFYEYSELSLEKKLLFSRVHKHIRKISLLKIHSCSIWAYINKNFSHLSTLHVCVRARVCACINQLWLNFIFLSLTLTVILCKT